MADHDPVVEVKERHTAGLLARPNVVGVGVGYKTVGNERAGPLSVVALVHTKMPRAALSEGALVPAELDGVPTDVVEVGHLRPLQARSGRWRPAPGGVSLGHYQVTAGTLGCWVRDRSSGGPLLLSNNHVLANSNAAQPGDAILQPGALDGGRQPGDILARLERFQPLLFQTAAVESGIAAWVVAALNACSRILGGRHSFRVSAVDPQAVNRVDAAVARPVDAAAVRSDILEIGAVEGTAPASLGMAVRKSGRSTGLTTGTVQVLETTLQVSYGEGRQARFERQIVTTPMSSPGDSGSLLVEAESARAVGLLFAGSDQSTIHNPIEAVLDALVIDL